MLRLEVTDRATEPPGPPRNYLFDRGPVCIGRSLRQNHISLRGNRISRVHIMLDLAENRWWLVHKGRFSPTTLNGKEIFHDEPVEVREGDLVVIERNELVVHVDIDGAEMPTQMLDATPEILAAQARIVAHARKVVGAAGPSVRKAPTPPPRPAPPPPPPPPVEVVKFEPPEQDDVDTFIDEELDVPAAPPAPPSAPPARAAMAPSPPPRPASAPSPPPVARAAPPPPPPAPPKPSQYDTQELPVRKPAGPAPIRPAAAPGTPVSAPSQLETQDVGPQRPGSSTFVAPPPRPASESETRIGSPPPSPPRQGTTPALPPVPGFDTVVKDRTGGLGDTHVPVPKGTPRFEERERLRSGGLGPILRAYDRAARTEAVVERLPAALVAGPEDAAAFHTLCGMLRGVAHAAVVRVLEAGQDEGGPFVLLELPPGRTLAEFMRSQPGGGSAQRIREITESLADGLAHLHECGVIHGNLHPGTVWVGNDGHARLLDAGFGAMAAQRASALGDADLGGVAYVAPESTRKTPRDPRSDQFGLGCVLYAYLTGEDPGARAAALTDRRKDVPRAVSLAIERAMSPSPDARFPSIQAFRESLYAPVKRTMPWTKVLAGAVVLLAAASAAGFATGFIPRMVRSLRRDAGAASACDAARAKALDAKAKWDAASGPAGVPPSESAQHAIDLLDTGRCAADEVRDADATAAFEQAAAELGSAAAAVTDLAQARDKARKLFQACSSAAKDSPAVAQAAGLIRDADQAGSAGKVTDATEKYRAAAAALDAAIARRGDAEVQAITAIRTQAERQVAQLEALGASNRKKADEANARVRSAEGMAGGSAASPRTAQLLADAKKAAAQAEADAARVAALVASPETKSVRDKIEEGAAALAAHRNDEARAAYQAAADASRALVEKAQGK